MTHTVAKESLSSAAVQPNKSEGFADTAVRFHSQGKLPDKDSKRGKRHHRNKADLSESDSETESDKRTALRCSYI